jgi:hypothetical protein
MPGLTKGPMPDITPPQIIGMALAGIPILAQLLRAFGVYDLSLEEQAALSDAVTWTSVVAGALISSDAILRVGRNLRRGHVESSIVQAQIAMGQTPNPALLPPEKGAPAGTTFQSATAGFEEPPPPTTP